MKQIILTSILCFYSLISIKAQTGSFNKQIMFNNESRQVSYYVPTNYDASKQYGLIVCLHGSGDNSANYRSGILNSLTWNTIFTNTIFVFPDGGNDYFSDFFSPKGDEAFIDIAIEDCKKNYNINSGNILLQGFSLGGRSALKLGLDHPEKYKGLLLNTPAIQGVQDLENKPDASLIYNYSNSKNIPIFLSVGMQDATYFDINEELVKIFKLNNASVYHQKISNMSHNIAVNAQIRKCLNFFDTKIVSSNDLDLFDVKSPVNACGNTVYADCFIRNNGTSTVNSTKLSVKIGAETFEKTYTVSIKPNEHVKVTFDFTPVNKQESGYTVKIENADLDSTNNSKLQLLSLSPILVDGVFKDGFENTKNWEIQKRGSLFDWYLDNTAKKSGSSSFGTYNSILFFYTNNSVESIVSKSFNLNQLVKKTVSFDVAFNYTKYTAPYFANDTIFADTLELQVSSDCGLSYKTIYKKGGKELATTANPMLNPVNISQLDFVPNENEWRREIIDLSAYAKSNNVFFRFNCISGMGGVLNIDNFSLGEDLMAVNQVKKEEKFISVYPNPANESFSFNLEKVESIRFLDLEGKLVSETKPELGVQTVNTSHLANGMYIVQFVSNDSVSSKRILIQH